MKTTPMRTNESAAGSTRLLHRLTAALLALVLAASAALPVFAADTAPTDTIYINSVSDLLAFADKCGFDQWSKGKTVILQEDLSLEDTEVGPRCVVQRRVQGQRPHHLGCQPRGGLFSSRLLRHPGRGRFHSGPYHQGCGQSRWYPEDRRRSGGHQLRHHHQLHVLRCCPRRGGGGRSGGPQ